MTEAPIWNLYPPKICLESYKIDLFKGGSDGEGMNTVLKFVELSLRLG